MDMPERCKYAYRKAGDVSLHCVLLNKYTSSQCAYQYYCNKTRRWEVNQDAGKCNVIQRETKDSNKKEGSTNGVRKTAKKGSADGK